MVFYRQFDKIIKTAVVIVFFTTMTTACQDHHYVPYDKMDQRPELGSGQDTKATKPQAQTTTATPSNNASEGFSGIIVSGEVDLADDVKNHSSKNWTLYIIARSGGGGAPLAVSKAVNVQFPYKFILDEKNIMMGVPQAGMKISLEARFDSDGDAGSKSPDDLYGKASGELTLGTDRAVITLNKQNG